MSALLLASLGIVCPTCDQFNPPEGTRCAGCGSPLTGPSRPAQAQGAQRPAAQPAPAPPPAQAQAPQAAPAPKPAAREAFPPGMRPARSGPSPIPATELLKKPAPAQPAPAPARAPAPAPSRFGLSVILGPSPGQRYRLGGAGCMVGRSRGAILFPDDPFVAAHHGTFILRDGKLFIRDEGTPSGIYVTVHASTPEPLRVGGFFAAGGRCFRYAGPLPRPPAPTPGQPQVYGAPIPGGQQLYALEEIVVGGRAARAVVTPGPLLTIGQSHCDLSYAGDGTLALRHCEVSPTAQGATLRDLSGGLGTFVRIQPGAERPLDPGDRVRIGQQVMQVEAMG